MRITNQLRNMLGRRAADDLWWMLPPLLPQCLQWDQVNQTGPNDSLAHSIAASRLKAKTYNPKTAKESVGSVSPGLVVLGAIRKPF